MKLVILMKLVNMTKCEDKAKRLQTNFDPHENEKCLIFTLAGDTEEDVVASVKLWSHHLQISKFDLICHRLQVSNFYLTLAGDTEEDMVATQGKPDDWTDAGRKIHHQAAAFVAAVVGD